MKKICVIGLGYIGLPTAAMLASCGYEVVGLDTNEKIVEVLNRGEPHLNEPDLKEMVSKHVQKGNLRGITLPEEAEVFIICVPTPLSEDKKADLSYVEEAALSILPFLRPGSLVILESTVGPRTTVDVLVPLLAESGLVIGEEIFVAHCPERVLPGKIIRELVENNRVIGGINEKSTSLAAEIYKRFVKGEIYLTDATTAEMIKLMENTYRDVNIALANEFARICARLGTNAWEAISIANKHPRVNIHNPGPGVGGHCLAVDPWFIVEKAPEEARLIAASRRINDSMPHYVVDLLENIVSPVKDLKLALLGVTYKGNVSDVRESPALKVMEILKEKNINFSIYDPLVQNLDGYQLSSLTSCLRGADCLVVLAAHDEFKKISPQKAGLLMRNKLVLDTHNILPAEAWEESGFTVNQVGRGRYLEDYLDRTLYGTVNR